MSQVESEVSWDKHESTVSSISAEALYNKCLALAHNLWWTWHPDVINLFRDLDPIRWRQLDHNPIALLREFTPERLVSRAAEMVLFSRINHAYRRLKEYMSTVPTWSSTHTGVLARRPVAYFSAEFGIHESIPIYSGGLGVLSGDHIKSASGLGVPLVAVGLFYDQGLFQAAPGCVGLSERRVPRHEGREPAHEPGVDESRGAAHGEHHDPGRHAVGQGVADAGGAGQAVPAGLRRRRKQSTGPRADVAALWRRRAHAHSPGVGAGRGRRASAFGRWASRRACYHLNEGHSAFATLEVIRQRMKEDGVPFDDALRESAQHTVFTTHTPVPAGHDRFNSALIEEHLGPLARRAADFARAADGAGPGRAAERIRVVLHDGAGAEALAACQRGQRTCTARCRGGCGRTCGRGAWKRKSRSATSPTACTCRAGWPGR